MTLLDAVTDQLERARGLDATADRLDGLWRQVLRRPGVTGALSGTAIGHPLHPAAVLVPAGSLLSATALDLLGGSDRDVRRLIGLGLLSAVPAALAGWSDWLDTEQAEKRVGLVHAASNVLGLTSYAVSLLRRRGGSSGRLSSLLGMTALGAGGYLGGHLAYAQGVGVDTTAFQDMPTDWTDVAAEDEVTEALTEVVVDGVPFLVTRLDGGVVALADRCTHRGGPLSDGERQSGCVVCPWHQSSFSLATGAVVNGPATRPQPELETRVVGGRVEVRRQEARSLRTNTA